MAPRRAFSVWLGLIALPLLAASACLGRSEVDGPPADGGGEGGAGGTEAASGGSSTGGTATGGASTGGSSSGGSSTGGTTANIDGPCSDSGERACDESDAQLTLICSQDVWQAAGSCSASEACAPATGLCTGIVPACMGGDPGDTYCSGDTVMECGPNLVSEQVVEECEGRCAATNSSASCVPASCGDGVPDAGETCDDGDADNDDSCTELCLLPACGDGFEQTGETCDDGDADNDDECTQLCEPPACGDGLLHASEDCDDGPNNGVLGFCGVDCVRRVVQVALGGEHSCALLDDASVKCWGRNNSGQLGLGDVSSRGDGSGEMGSSLPTIDLGVERSAVALAAGDGHTCALLDDDSLKCWGRNNLGQLGLGDVSLRGDGSGEMGDSLPAIDLGAERSVVTMAAGDRHTCALLDDDSLKCWGSNEYGQLGLGDTNDRGDGAGEMGDNLPSVDLSPGRSAKALALGGRHTCAILDDDSVKCWGDNSWGQLGLGNTAHRGDGSDEMGDFLLTVELGSGRSAQALAAGDAHTCALLDDDSVKCWGRGSFGQLGLGSIIERGDQPGDMGDSLPSVDLGAGRSAQALVAGAHHTCTVLDDDSVKCWGDNTYGQLGLGNTAHRGDDPSEMGDGLLPIDLGSGRSVHGLDSGRNHACGLLDDDSVKCWGDSAYGQLGLGDSSNRGDMQGEMGDDLPAIDLW